MSEIIWSDESKADLKEVYDFIANDSIYFAEKQIKSIIERAGTIIKQLTKGRPVPEYNSPFVRQILEGKYRIIYHTELLPNIEIVRVFHSARILKT